MKVYDKAKLQKLVSEAIAATVENDPQTAKCSDKDMAWEIVAFCDEIAEMILDPVTEKIDYEPVERAVAKDRSSKS